MNLRLCALVAFTLHVTSLPAQSADLTGCFAATYDKAHMAKYPGQTPTMLGVLIKHEDGNIIMELTARLRGKKGVWGEAGGCFASGASLQCNIDCDGGGFLLTPDGDEVTLKNTSGFRLSKTSCEGEEEVHRVEAVPGNRMFRLKKVEETVCE